MKKQRITRFSISMPGNLAGQLDAMTKARGFASRSQAIADMVRSHLVEHHARIGAHKIAGTVTLVYDHHKRDIQALLTEIQHDHQGLIISTLHVHLDHHNCMEVLVVRGHGDKVNELANRLTSAKGVKHGKLSITATGKEISG